MVRLQLFGIAKQIWSVSWKFWIQILRTLKPSYVTTMHCINPNFSENNNKSGKMAKFKVNLANTHYTLIKDVIKDNYDW